MGPSLPPSLNLWLVYSWNVLPVDLRPVCFVCNLTLKDAFTALVSTNFEKWIPSRFPGY